MSVNLKNRRHVGTLIALIIGTITLIVAGSSWLRGGGQALIVEVAYAFVVLIVALYVYDRVLVQ